VGLAEELPALGVTDDDIAHVQLGEHGRADLAGVRAVVLPVTVLRAEDHRDLVGVHEVLQRPDVGEWRADHDVDRLVVVLLEEEGQLLHRVDGDEMVVVHLPVGRDDRVPGLAHVLSPRPIPARSAARPGRSPCSMNSSDAPPPVLTWSTRSASPNSRIAAALSPPPITVKPGQSATASATR